ncbi:MAG TPA: hypothetical protein VK646_04545 [Actinomycetota bacterium]|nr:hypothetical protein [Actinomycetota bacterium]
MRGRPRFSRLVVAVATALLLASCSRTGLGTPAPSTGPAFQMTVISPVPCDVGVIATACVQVKISNLGDEEGDGSCRLVSASGVQGDVFPVSGIGPGASLMTTALWTEQVPDPPIFSGVCEPGLRS